MSAEVSRPIGAAIVGLGRAGWSLHAAALTELPDYFRVVSAFDAQRERAQEAGNKFGFRSPDSFEQLLKHPQLEVVILAVPSHLHEALCIQALRAGKHVLVEKPFSTDLQSADRMIAAAVESGRILTCSQNRRFSNDFLKIREIIASGVLGRILQVRIAWHRFRRRWDWQTLKEYGGGNLNNDGAHVVDLGLLLFGDGEPRVLACMERSQLSSGDAENHVKIVLSGRGAPIVDLEMTDNCAYSQSTWLLMGSLGTLTGSVAHLEWKYIDPAALTQRPVSRMPTEDRSYNSEQLEWKSESCDFEGDQHAVSLRRVYKDLYSAIRSNRSPSVTLESLRRQIEVIEECRRQGEQK